LTIQNQTAATFGITTFHLMILLRAAFAPMTNDLGIHGILTFHLATFALSTFALSTLLYEHVF
jgi:hypothetical protein